MVYGRLAVFHPRARLVTPAVRPAWHFQTEDVRMSTPPEVNRPTVPHRTPRRPPPAELERMLRADASQRALPKDLREHIAAELRQLRRLLEQVTCSAAWLSQCWESGDAFPPAAQTTPMIACRCERCRRTGRRWPAHYAAPVSGAEDAPDGRPAGGFLSYECYLESLSDEGAANLPSSPSGLALRAIREGRIKLRRQRTHTAARRFVS
jgi:hypothetical protein